MSDQPSTFNDPTALFDGHIDGGMHDGCPCRACAFTRPTSAQEGAL